MHMHGIVQFTWMKVHAQNVCVFQKQKRKKKQFLQQYERAYQIDVKLSEVICKGKMLWYVHN